MARIMVTGAAGFIGSNLCKRLISEGHDVVGVDDLSAGHHDLMWPLFSGQPNSWWQIDDFSAEEVLQGIRKGRYDSVIHLAAKPRVSYSVEHPLETNETNVNKTLKLLDACKGNIERFVFASSSSVYGGLSRFPTTLLDGTALPMTPQSEMDHINPQSPYALQKAIIEMWLQQYAQHYGLRSIALRFFNVFGPGSVSGGAYAMAITSWLTAIKNGVPMRCDGDGSQTRDLCYVENTVDAIYRAAVKNSSSLDRRGAHIAINVACGQRTSNKEILEYLQARYPGACVAHAPARPGDVKDTLADISRAKLLLGYTPLVDPWEGIKRTCDWYDNNWDFIQKLQKGKP